MISQILADVYVLGVISSPSAPGVRKNAVLKSCAIDQISLAPSSDSSGNVGAPEDAHGKGPMIEATDMAPLLNVRSAPSTEIEGKSWTVETKFRFHGCRYSFVSLSHHVPHSSVRVQGSIGDLNR